MALDIKNVRLCDRTGREDVRARRARFGLSTALWTTTENCNLTDSVFHKKKTLVEFS